MGRAIERGMRFLSFGTVAIALFAVACSSADGPGGTGGAGSSSTGLGGAGGKAPSCIDPSITTDAPCGSLSFTASDVLSRKRNHHGTFLVETQAGPFLFVVGGTNGAFPMKNVDRHAIRTDGSLDVAADQTPLPIGVGGFTGGVVGSTIVIAGGMAGSKVADQSYAAVVGGDGTLGAWTKTGTVGHPRMHPGAIVNGDSLYVLGGFDDPTVWDDVVRATVSTDGTVSAWTPAGTLPAPRSHFSVTRVGEYVYLAGGLEKSALINPPLRKETWMGHIAADGTLGEWAPMPPLPVGLATHASFFYGGYLYVGGGINPSTQEKRLWRSPVAADHTLGAWEETASFSIARAHVHQLPVYQNHVYSFAGAIDYDLASTDEIDIGTFQ